MEVYLKFVDIDRHGEGCRCGVCNSIGKAFGVGIFELGGNGEPLVVGYSASMDAAFHNAQLASGAEGWRIVEPPDDEEEDDDEGEEN